jgi:hypothetical protein
MLLKSKTLLYHYRSINPNKTLNEISRKIKNSLTPNKKDGEKTKNINYTT